MKYIVIIPDGNVDHFRRLSVTRHWDNVINHSSGVVDIGGIDHLGVSHIEGKSLMYGEKIVGSMQEVSSNTFEIDTLDCRLAFEDYDIDELSVRCYAVS